MTSRRRRFAYRAAVVIAIAMTSLFAFVCLLDVEVAWLRKLAQSAGGWRAEGGIVRIEMGGGQLRFQASALPIVVDYTTPSGRPSWYWACRWSPKVRVDVKQTYRTASRLGVDGFVANGGRTVGFGVFLAYPAALAWLVVCLLAPRRREPGRCAACGYDVRATPDRCPECGTAVAPDERAGRIAGPC